MLVLLIVRVVPNGITSIPNFIQICPVVLELNHMDRWVDGQTWSALYMFTSCTSCKEYTISRFIPNMQKCHTKEQNVHS
jgi:hypothetical protein